MLPLLLIATVSAVLVYVTVFNEECFNMSSWTTSNWAAQNFGGFNYQCATQSNIQAKPKYQAISPGQDLTPYQSANASFDYVMVARTATVTFNFYEFNGLSYSLRWSRTLSSGASTVSGSYQLNNTLLKSDSKFYFECKINPITAKPPRNTCRFDNFVIQAVGDTCSTAYNDGTFMCSHNCTVPITQDDIFYINTDGDGYINISSFSGSDWFIGFQTNTTNQCLMRFGT